MKKIEAFSLGFEKKKKRAKGKGDLSRPGTDD